MKPARGPAIGVKGCVNTQEGGDVYHCFKAYEVVEGTCGTCAVGLVCLLCLCSHHTNTSDGVNIGVNSMGSSDKL